MTTQTAELRLLREAVVFLELVELIEQALEQAACEDQERLKDE